MKSIEIQGQLRTETGKKASKKLRKAGFVPCELYGGKDNVHFCVEERQLNKIIYTPFVYIVSLNIDGKKHNAIIKETIFHPVSDAAIHMDFVEVFDDKKAVVKLPVKITGNSIGIRNGGKLRLIKRLLNVSGFPKDLPDFLDIDITSLNIGASKKVKDLKYNGLELTEPASAVVVSVVSSRLSKSMGGEEAAAEEETEEGAEENAEATESSSEA